MENNILQTIRPNYAMQWPVKIEKLCLEKMWPIQKFRKFAKSNRKICKILSFTITKKKWRKEKQNCYQKSKVIEYIVPYIWYKRILSYTRNTLYCTVKTLKSQYCRLSIVDFSLQLQFSPITPVDSLKGQVKHKHQK